MLCVGTCLAAHTIRRKDPEENIVVAHIAIKSENKTLEERNGFERK